MTLKSRIETDLVAALKAHDALKLSVLRMIKTAVTNKEIELRSTLEDKDVIGVLTTLAKKANESIEQFTAGGRSDLADKEKAELCVIKAYLPSALSETEIETIIDAAIKESGAASPRDMGKVMKLVQPKVQGRSDGKFVSSLVQKKLQG